VGGVGFDLLITQPGRRMLRGIVFLLALSPVPTYLVAPIVAQKVQYNLATEREVPFRNDYTWFLRPWYTGYRIPEKFADEVFNTIEDNAIIYADGASVYPLLYAQEIQGKRKDVKIISSHPNRGNPVVFDEQTLPELLARTSVYVVSKKAGYCPQFLLEQYEFQPAGVIWKVVVKSSPARPQHHSGAWLSRS
jgi:hypothetical protein